jgi:hypothetical protein
MKKGYNAMKSNSITKATISVIMIILVILMALPVGATEVTSSVIESSGGTAGVWMTEATHSLTSRTLTNVCGGDVGIWFYSVTNGMQASFVRSDSRKAYIECYENDYNTSEDDLAREYTATFATDGAGIYAPSYFRITDTYSQGIEGQAGVELYMKYKINTVWGDDSTSVPIGIFNYQFWVY